MSKILITGAAGMLGSLMVDYILKNTDFYVFGMVRPHSSPNFDNLSDSIKNERFRLVYGDLLDGQSIEKLIQEIRPDIIFNFACPSLVSNSWAFPAQTFEAGSIGIIYLLEAIRKYVQNCKFITMGSSEELANAKYTPQDESHPLGARSLYGAAKASSRLIIASYKEKYALNACQPFLYNNEHYRRGDNFLSTKLTKGVARIVDQLNNVQEVTPIELGSLDSYRDFSASEDFIEGLWLIAKQNQLKNYILSSNKIYSIREFVKTAFDSVGIRGKWDKDDYYLGTIKLVTTNPAFFRAPEPIVLRGNNELIFRELGWKPKIDFNQLVCNLVKYQVLKYEQNYL